MQIWYNWKQKYSNAGYRMKMKKQQNKKKKINDIKNTKNWFKNTKRSKTKIPLISAQKRWTYQFVQKEIPRINSNMEKVQGRISN